jgi:micrococcal nuclease
MNKWMLFFLACFANATQAAEIQAKVTRVSDGDTLWLAMNSASKPIKLRLQGIDAPEICQAGGGSAQQALSARLLGQTVSVNIRAKDDYKRSLGRITHQGQDVGQWLVSQGHAWSYGYAGRPGPYAAAQAQAQQRRVGLWAASSRPTEPRQFRKAHGPCKL